VVVLGFLFFFYEELLLMKMSYFKPLEANESLFSNIDSLDLDFVPKLLPHRENEQKVIAEALSPLLEGRDGKNLLVVGRPGIGKTHAVKRVLEDLEMETDEVKSTFVNCWSAQESNKVLVKVCEGLGFRFVQGMSEAQLIEKTKQFAENRKGIVLVFDEIDKAKDYDFLYLVLEEIEKKTIIMISNEVKWLSELDERIRSRLLPETVLFKEYDLKETKDILEERKKYAFFEGSWSQEAFELVVQKTFNARDIRVGVKLLREAD
jgi:cell division control protein 6